MRNLRACTKLLLLVAFTLRSISAWAGETGVMLNLLQQSHDLNQQLAVQPRANMLARQAEMVAEIDTEVGREWANELFALASQIKGNRRLFLETEALGILAHSDPSHALELLHSMGSEEASANLAVASPQMLLAGRIFGIVVEREGASALPRLQHEADLMASQGHYPYSALAYAAMQATSRDWGGNTKHAVAVLQTVFEPAFARYSQTVPEYRDTLEFGKMLKVLAGGLPFDVVKPAVHRLVENILTTDPNKVQVGAKIYTNDGETGKVNNAVDATLLFFGTLIQRDPELTQELESTRPEMQRTLEFAKEGRHRSMTFGPGAGGRPANMAARDATLETASDAVMFAHSNPETAMSKAQQLPEGERRTQTMLAVAQGMASEHPEQAAQLIAETERSGDFGTAQMKLNLISAQAAVAAAQKKTNELEELLRRGYELAGPLVQQSAQQGGQHLVTGLGALVRTGMQNDQALTASFLQSLPPSYEKAELLLAAASALQIQARTKVGAGKN